MQRAIILRRYATNKKLKECGCGHPGFLQAITKKHSDRNIRVTTSCLAASDGPIYRFKQVSVQLPTSAVNLTLPAFAAKRRAVVPLLLRAGACCQRAMQQSIDISCPPGRPGAQQQTHTPLLLSIDWTDRQTDGQTVS